MSTLNPNLILGAVQETVPLNDLASVYKNAAAMRGMRAELNEKEEQARKNQVLNAAYQAATGPDGKVDNAILQSELAKGMAGSHIPAVQKANNELLKGRADIADKQADTQKTVQEIMYKGLSMVDNTIAGLAAKPAVTDREVYGEMGRLVSAGAFDAQAKQKGVSPDDYARELLSTMPVGNPQALKAWLIQAGARTADATQRLKMMLPQYDEQDRGGVINQGTIDQFSGTRTAGQDIQKTVTPDAQLSASTSVRGQDLQDRRAKQYNDITAEAANSQVVETPQGYNVINKGTAMARPVALDNGQPVLGKDSQVAKNAQMANRMLGMIPLAKELMTDTTASGIGAKIDRMNAELGISTPSGDAATALEALGGWMTSNVPRFEGPQSNQDTNLYSTMAGLVGDRTKPISTRVKALDTIGTLMKQYQGQSVAPFSGPPGTDPATVVAPRPTTPQRYTGLERRGAAPAGGGRPPIESFFRQ